MKEIGNVLFCHDNGAHFFHGAPTGVLCCNCRACLDFHYSPETLKIETFYDFSQTQDNRLICSQRAKDFFLTYFDVRVSAVGAWRGNSLYHVSPKSIVPFNSLARGTRFVDHCDVCGSYKSIVGATPAYLAIERIGDRSFFRTDLVFGSYEEKASLNIVGLATAKDLHERGFSGCVFKAAFSLV